MILKHLSSQFSFKISTKVILEGKLKPIELKSSNVVLFSSSLSPRFVLLSLAILETDPYANPVDDVKSAVSSQQSVRSPPIQIQHRANDVLPASLAHGKVSSGIYGNTIYSIQNMIHTTNISNIQNIRAHFSHWLPPSLSSYLKGGKRGEGGNDPDDDDVRPFLADVVCTM